MTSIYFLQLMVVLRSGQNAAQLVVIVIKRDHVQIQGLKMAELHVMVHSQKYVISQNVQVIQSIFFVKNFQKNIFHL